MRMVYLTETEIKVQNQMTHAKSGIRFVEMSDDDIKLLGDAKEAELWAKLYPDWRERIEANRNRFLAEQKQKLDEAYESGLETGKVIGQEAEKTAQTTARDEACREAYLRGVNDTERQRNLENADFVRSTFVQKIVDSGRQEATDKAYKDGMQAGVIAERERIDAQANEKRFEGSARSAYAAGYHTAVHELKAAYDIRETDIMKQLSEIRRIVL